MDSTATPLTFEGNSRTFELNPHILPQIYSWLMPYEMLDGSIYLPNAEVSLRALVRGTLVCRRWRKILVNSALLWAQCLNFTVFQRQDALLLGMVIQRSQEAPMTVTGKLKTNIRDDNSKRILAFLEKYWCQIRNLDLTFRITEDGARWSHCMAPILSLPAHIMRHFSLRVQMSPFEGSIQGVGVIPLFFQDFPMLQRLSLSVPYATLPIRITPSHSRLRFIHLSLGDRIVADSELLYMCTHVPMLERLTLELSTLVLTGTNLLPILPRLTFIKINSHDLTVYPAFLQRIRPAYACNLLLTDDHIEWENISTDTIVHRVKMISHTLHRYLHSLFSSQDEALPEMRIRMTKLRLVITSTDPYFFEIKWVMPENCNPAIFAKCFGVILTNLSCVPYPRQFTLLDLVTDSRCLPHSADVLRLLTSMSTITSLATSIEYLLHIEKDVIALGLLPRLVTLILHGEGRIEDIKPFLLYRYHITPIRRLDLTGADQGIIEYACPLLDEFYGLELVWFPDFPGRKETYMCGSGGLRCAKRAPYYVSHMT